jgi:hypothetical protein
MLTVNVNKNECGFASKLPSFVPGSPDPRGFFTILKGLLMDIVHRSVGDLKINITPKLHYESASTDYSIQQPKTPPLHYHSTVPPPIPGLK